MRSQSINQYMKEFYKQTPYMKEKELRGAHIGAQRLLLRVS